MAAALAPMDVPLPDLSDDTLSAILNLAAAGPPPVAPAAPSMANVGARIKSVVPTPSTRAPGEVRIAMWDEARGIKLTGADAPTVDELPAFLAVSTGLNSSHGERDDDAVPGGQRGLLCRASPPTTCWSCVAAYKQAIGSSESTGRAAT